MNRQEAFDKAVVGLYKQGKLGLLNDGCHYYQKDGTRCAAGMLAPIPWLKKARLDEEDCNYTGSRLNTLRLAIGMKKENMTFLEDLQSAHDYVKDFEGLESNMRDLAEIYRLKTQALDKAVARYDARVRAKV